MLLFFFFFFKHNCLVAWLLFPALPWKPAQDRLFLIKSGKRVSPPENPQMCAHALHNQGLGCRWTVSLEAPRMAPGTSTQRVASGFPGGGEPRAVSSGDSREDSPLPKAPTQITHSISPLPARASFVSIPDTSRHC